MNARVKVPHLALRVVRERTMNLPGEWVRDAAEASRIAVHLIGDRPVEFMIAILINGRARITGTATIAQGGMHGVGIVARDVLRPVLVAQASAFVLAHNHPSGDPTPSREDVVFTEKIREAAQIVGVPMLDHIVVVADGSFRSVTS